MRHLTLALLLLTSCLASAEQVYKWVDESGTVHFAEQPPRDREYETINVRSLAPAEPAESASRQQATQQADNAAEQQQRLTRPGTEITTEDPEKVAENCARARRNIEVINARRRVMVEGEDGDQRRMSDEERMQLLEESRAYIADNCKDEE